MSSVHPAKKLHELQVTSNRHIIFLSFIFFIFLNRLRFIIHTYYLSNYGEQVRYDTAASLDFMKEMDGIATGRAIRKKDVKVEIILATGSDQYLREGYELHAFAYLMKPYDVMQVRATICDYFSRNQVSTHDEDMEFLCFSVQQKKFCIKQREISVIESEGRVVYIYHGDEKYRAYQRLNTIEHKLNMKYFLSCNQSYIINVEQVDGVIDYDFHMKNGMVIPIRKRDKKDIVQKYYQKKSELND